ncbi:MAG: hypothetical protein CK429_32715 [Mycobacterium sp.]|nr:MAG: hypothetical protein CK429_32715 [Mycobacterium sp.]
MFQVLLASHNGQLYKRRVRCVADIADLIREGDLETLTSSDGTVDFWFTPSTRSSHRGVNRKATEIYLATTGFTPHNVPLMRGIVVLAAHDVAGGLAGLTDQQIDTLAGHVERTSWWQDLVLARRYARDRRRELRTVRTARKHQHENLPWPS